MSYSLVFLPVISMDALESIFILLISSIPNEVPISLINSLVDLINTFLGSLSFIKLYVI